MSGIKNLHPNKKSPFKQGYYVLQYPQKYIGDITKVIYRSSWEKRLMKRLDLSANVLEWSSEPVAIKYFSPLDKKEHKYYVDFYAKWLITNDDGTSEEKKYLIEVKPTKDYLVKPIFESKRRTKKALANYKRSMETWIINQAKFDAARKFAITKGMEFIMFNENNL